MIVIYAEKPSLARQIAEGLGMHSRSSGCIKGRYNGEEAVITWGFGHLGVLKMPEDYNPDYKDWKSRPQPFMPEDLELKWSADAKEQIAIVRELFASASYVINACDDDREGDLIFEYVIRLLPYNGEWKRVRLNSTTPKGVADAFASLESAESCRSRTIAGECRSMSDWYVGINMTVSASLKYMPPGAGVMSLGRVQTPTLAMIVEREDAIRAHTVKPIWTPVANVDVAGQIHEAICTKNKLEDKQEADTIMKAVSATSTVTLEDLEDKETRKGRPDLFSQAALQIEASKVYGFTLEQTSSATQTLYESGYITYPGTNSGYLPSDYQPKLLAAISVVGEYSDSYTSWIDRGSIDYIDDKLFNDAKTTSHFAIVPTEVTPSRSLTDDEKCIYDLIVKSVLRQLYPPALLAERVATYATAGYTFKAKGVKVLDSGWWEIDGPERDFVELPDVVSGEAYPATFALKEGATTPPKRFTDGTLVAAMEAAGKKLDDEELARALANPEHQGIGTARTRKEIRNTLVKRDYITYKGKQIIPTAKGIATIHSLTVDALKSAKLTAEWEKRLGEIENADSSAAQAEGERFMEDLRRTVATWVQKIEESEDGQFERESFGACPSCGAIVIELPKSYTCEKPREECDFVIWKKIAGKKIPAGAVKDLLSSGRSKRIKGFKNRKGEAFSAVLVLKSDMTVGFEDVKKG